MLTCLRTNGVNVIAGTYTVSWLRGLRKMKSTFFDDSQTWVSVPRGDTKDRSSETELVLSIHCGAKRRREEVVPIKTGLSWKISNATMVLLRLE